MGLSLVVYALLAVSGGWGNYRRRHRLTALPWLRVFHVVLGGSLVGLTLLLLGVGVVGTLGHFGSLGHSAHLGMGLLVTGLVLLSAWSATRIHPQRSWARKLHVSTNGVLFLGFLGVLVTGWQVVQKYLP